MQTWSFFWSVFSRILTEYRDFFLFSANMRKYGPEKLRIWSLFQAVVCF